MTVFDDDTNMESGGLELSAIQCDASYATNSYQQSQPHTKTSTDSSLTYSPLPLNELEGWKRPLGEGSLPEYHGLIDVNSDPNAPWYVKIWAYLGPGALVAVGYMDPGNWSTDIAGGSAYGYKLLSVVFMSSVIGMYLQVLALRVGLATRRDLAQACRDAYPKPLVVVFWIVIEVAICATDVAEVIGSAVALKLLFGLPIFYGVMFTAFDVLLVLFLNGKQFRYIEVIVTSLVLLMAVCFAVQLGMSHPVFTEMLVGLIPTRELFTDRDMLFVAVGIIGATVM